MIILSYNQNEILDQLFKLDDKRLTDDVKKQLAYDFKIMHKNLYKIKLTDYVGWNSENPKTVKDLIWQYQLSTGEDCNYSEIDGSANDIELKIGIKLNEDETSANQYLKDILDKNFDQYFKTYSIGREMPIWDNSEMWRNTASIYTSFDYYSYISG